MQQEQQGDGPGGEQQGHHKTDSLGQWKGIQLPPRSRLETLCAGLPPPMPQRCGSKQAFRLVPGPVLPNLVLRCKFVLIIVIEMWIIYMTGSRTSRRRLRPCAKPWRKCWPQRPRRFQSWTRWVQATFWLRLGSQRAGGKPWPIACTARMHEPSILLPRTCSLLAAPPHQLLHA